MKWLRPIAVVLCAVFIEVVLINHMFCVAVFAPQRNTRMDSYTSTEICLENTPWICNIVITAKNGTNDGDQFTVMLGRKDGQEVCVKSGKAYSGRVKVFPICKADSIAVYSDSGTNKELSMEINRVAPVISLARILAMIIIYYVGVLLFGLQSMPDYRKYMGSQEV